MKKIICCHRQASKQRKQSHRAPLTMWHKETSLWQCFCNFYLSYWVKAVFLPGLLGLWRKHKPHKALSLAHSFISEGLSFLEMENMGHFWCSLCWFCCLITTLIAKAAGSESEFSNPNSWHAPTQGWVFQLRYCSSLATGMWGMNVEGITQHFQHFFLFLPGN